MIYYGTIQYCRLQILFQMYYYYCDLKPAWTASGATTVAERKKTTVLRTGVNRTTSVSFPLLSPVAQGSGFQHSPPDSSSSHLSLRQSSSQSNGQSDKDSSARIW